MFARAVERYGAEGVSENNTGVDPTRLYNSLEPYFGRCGGRCGVLCGARCGARCGQLPRFSLYTKSPQAKAV